MTPAAEPKRPKLLDQLRGKLRVMHYSLRTEKQYVQWVIRFILFHNKCHPERMDAEEVTRFLTHLAVVGQVSASTQNQALSALLFLYRHVLEQDLPWLKQLVRARATRHVPVVLSVSEVQAVLGQMHGTPGLIARLVYGTGMRLMEGLRLRVKDIGFDQGEIIVRDGKSANVPIAIFYAWEPCQKSKILHHLQLNIPISLGKKFLNCGFEVFSVQISFHRLSFER